MAAWQGTVIRCTFTPVGMEQEATTFRTSKEATQALGAHLAEPELGQAVAALVPTLAFAPDVGDPGTPGRTRFGGSPDLPPGSEWPRPPMPDDPEAIACLGSDEAAEHMRRHFALGLPYAFVGQIDLAEAAACGSAAAPLPTDGRLLFFYDLIVGCYQTGTRPCRVLWDRTPTAALRPLPMPRALAEAEEEYRGEMRDIRTQYGLDAAAVATEGTNYGTPPRALKLVPELAFPHDMSVEGQAFWKAHGDAVPYPTDDALWQRSKFLGCPDPVQDDPRWNAVVATVHGVQHMSSEEWAERRDAVAAGVRDWTLLLQLDLADWMAADMTEGCVFFLIRQQDLVDRRFEHVVSVYQQT